MTDLSTPVIVGIILLVLIVVIVLIVVGANASKRRKQRQQEEDRRRAAEIREEAARHGFATASKPDSYDICFIPDGNTQAFLGRSIGMRPGMIKDTEDANSQELRRTFGVFQLTMISVGATLGTGILVILGEAVPIAGPGVWIAFILAGIPSGGLFTGAEGIKTPEQAALWGGTAGVATSASNAGSASAADVPGVRMNVGATQLTVIPRDATS